MTKDASLFVRQQKYYAWTNLHSLLDVQIEIVSSRPKMYPNDPSAIVHSVHQSHNTAGDYFRAHCWFYFPCEMTPRYKTGNILPRIVSHHPTFREKTSQTETQDEDRHCSKCCHLIKECDRVVRSSRNKIVIFIITKSCKNKHELHFNISILF